MSTQNYGNVSGININSGSNTFQACKLSDGNYQVSLTDSNSKVVYDNEIVDKTRYDQIKADWERECETWHNAKNKILDGFTKFFSSDVVSNSDKKVRNTPNRIHRAIRVGGVEVDENTKLNGLEQLGVTNCNICTEDNVTQTMVVNEGKSS